MTHDELTIIINTIREYGTAKDMIKFVISIRNNARKIGNYEIADRIRSGLLSCGIILEDREDGTTWKVKKTL